MTVQIAVANHDPHTVSLTRSGDRAVAWIDGRPCPTTVTSEGGTTVVEIEGMRETVFTTTVGDTVHVHAFGRAWTLSLSDPVESTLRGADTADAASAPMPGTVVAVAVDAGDEVVRGQVVAVIESMKMQTEIPAPRDGVVKRVLVRVGENFDSGAALVALVPAADTGDNGEGA